MDGDESFGIYEYDVSEDGNGFQARLRHPLNTEALAAGCKQVLSSESFEDLELLAIANRIKASWYR
ncbi:hypothetical protein [Planomonospora venezuelensis]|uniref:Uncharacterized protein n=1 Tax=Planomonospora venezuelensis TaxID=1999 RepID=A0A841CXK7_PLAVE|nr:hypothetical protein [Planomonospora venezuelensis]MBB5960858.1 hypothetical protein [Planomonospora venezuelensis]GIN01092.1 hypothetical protein Pve01_27500 [Planomonospora venezuelensis]